jgi:hypothetical protein
MCAAGSTECILSGVYIAVKKTFLVARYTFGVKFTVYVLRDLAN